MSSTSAPESAGWSLATRLTLWYAGSSFLILVGATAFLSWALHSNLDREDDQHLANKVHALQDLLRDWPDDRAALQREIEGPGTGPYVQFLVRVLDSEGRTLLETPGMDTELPRDRFPTPLAVGEPPGHGREARSAAGRQYRLVAIQVDSPPSAQRLALQVAFDQTYEETLLAGYRRNLYIVLAVSLVVCAVVSYRIAHRGLKPLAAITTTAARIRSTTLYERLRTDRLPAELFSLAITFNHMLDRLEESFTRLSRFSADIAHELRTPVNNLRGEAEVALGKARSVDEYREVLGSCLEECDRLAHLIDGLLFLARAENPQTQIPREPVDVGREVETVRSYYEAAAAEAGVALASSAGADLLIAGDRTLLQRAAGNLVANALAHTPPGGAVQLTAHGANASVIVEISDTGTGIAPEHLAHVFDRFYRADPARTGSSGRVGLGLAIVKSIATLHQGTVTIDSTPGKGTRVTLTFPRLRKS